MICRRFSSLAVLRVVVIHRMFGSCKRMSISLSPAALERLSGCGASDVSVPISSNKESANCGSCGIRTRITILNTERFQGVRAP